MGFLDDLFKEFDQLRREKDVARGFADGVAQARHNEQHPIIGTACDAIFGDLERLSENEDYLAAKRAGEEYQRKYGR